MPRNDSTSHT